MTVECFVPLCGNSNENVLFLVPNEPEDEKRLWFSIMGVDLSEWCKDREAEDKSLTAFVCQDHVNIIKNIVNRGSEVLNNDRLNFEDPLEIYENEEKLTDPLALEIDVDDKVNFEESMKNVSAEEGLIEDRRLGRDHESDHLEFSQSVPKIRIKKPNELISSAQIDSYEIPVVDETGMEIVSIKMPSSTTQRFKQCVVPNCPSTTDNRSDDDFVCVPMTVIRKKAWMEVIGKEWTDSATRGLHHCCVEHFNESDLEDYNQNFAGGRSVTKKRVKDGILPSRNIRGKGYNNTIGLERKRKPAPKSVLEARQRKAKQQKFTTEESNNVESNCRSLKLCRVCIELFESDISYEAHLQFPCSQNRPILFPTKCKACQMSCSSLEDLANHVESVHKYICLRCEESLGNIEEIASHVADVCNQKNGENLKRVPKAIKFLENPENNVRCDDVEFVKEEQLGRGSKAEEEKEVPLSAYERPRKSLREKRRAPAKLVDDIKNVIFSKANGQNESSVSEDGVTSGTDDNASGDDRGTSRKKKKIFRGPGCTSSQRKSSRYPDEDPDYRPSEKESDSDPDDPESHEDIPEETRENVNLRVLVTLGAVASKAGIATCWKCKQRFKNLSALKNHMHASSGCQMDASRTTTTLRIQCKSCMVYFTSSLGLGLHLKRSKICMKKNPGVVLPGVVPMASNNRVPNGESDEKVFMCHKCKATFTSVWGLRTHERNSTACKPERPYAIPVPIDKEEAEKCKKERDLDAKKSDIRKEPTIVYTPRVQSNDGTHFKCKNCQAIFTSVWGLRTHERISLKCGKNGLARKGGANKKPSSGPKDVFPSVGPSNTPEDFTCKKCLGKFATSRAYNAHVRLSTYCGNGLRSVKRKLSTPVVKGRNDESEGVFACPMCQKSFIRPLEFIIHFSEHGNLVKSRGKYNCFVCQKKFSDLSSLYRHTYCDHVGEWFCPVCSFNFNSFKLFFEHINGQHNNGVDKKLPQCRNCLKSFAKLDYLNLHSMNCPLSPKSTFSCYICAKKFLKKMHIANHIKYGHMNLRPDDKYRHACNKCPRLFASELELTEHLKEDCSQAEEIVQCDLCPSSFLGRMFLKKHIALCHAELNPLEEAGGLVTVKEEFNFVEIKQEDSGMEPEYTSLEFEGES